MYASNNIKNVISYVICCINELFHEEPYSFLFHGLFWSIGLICICPIIGLIYSFMILLEIMNHYFKEKRNLIDLNERINILNVKKAELAVYITGCDSGFGKDVALCLAEKGFQVFAGCLTDDGMKQFEVLNGSIISLKVDVTKDNDCSYAAETVTKWINHKPENVSSRILHAVINNAGIGIVGLIDWTDMSIYQKSMDVNYFGSIRTIKSFLPILKQQTISQKYEDHRIINVISMAGLLYNSGLSSYYGSKHAQEAFSSCLRIELQAFYIKVITINPSYHETPMPNAMETQIHSSWDQLQTSIKEEYGLHFFHSFKQKMLHVKSHMWNSSVVVDSIVTCVISTNPPYQLIVGSDAKFQGMFARLLPKPILENILALVLPLEQPASMKSY